MSALSFDGIEIRNRKMRDVIETVQAAAEVSAGLLIIGPSGSGKTFLARWVHRQGRPGRNLVSISFRDQKEVHWEPLFAEARNSTLLLEDLDACPLHVQASLVEAMDRSSEGDRPRLIGTSRRELRSAARQDLFRQDLYYRLSVLSVEVPSLEARQEDILPLSRFLVDVNAILQGKEGLVLSAAAEERLMAWDWPGNIRELENVLERAVVLSKSLEIEADHIVFETTGRPPVTNFGAGLSLSEAERRLILQTLELTAQNRTRAAQMLGISIRTLRNKLNEYREAGIV